MRATAVVLALLACASVPATASAQARYVAIGDSIAAAADSSVDRFAERLWIAAAHPRLTLTLVAHGAGGASRPLRLTLRLVDREARPESAP